MFCVNLFYPHKKSNVNQDAFWYVCVLLTYCVGRCLYYIHNIYVEDILCFIYIYHYCCKLSELAWDMADVYKVNDINTFFLTQQLLSY